MIGYFISNQESGYYQSEAFTNMLNYVQNNGKICVMKERKTKKGLRLLITFIHIDTIEKALRILSSI